MTKCALTPIPNTLIDAADGKNWNANEWAPGVVKIWAGTGINQVRRITGNTATTITVATDWQTEPDSTSKYWIINTSTWEKWDDVNNDNKSDDGTTNTSWNLQ